ncbi:MAG: hypothetical protein V7746_14075 [Halioglobus sp.]
MKISKILTAATAVGFMVAGPAHVLADNPGGWEYSLAPLFLWGKNINGFSEIGGKEAPLDLDFNDDILGNLDGAFTFHFEAKQGPLTLFAEYNYAKLDPTADETLGPITITADIDFKDTMWELGVAYAFADNDRTRWEVLGGVRHMEQEIDAEIGADFGPGAPKEISGGDDWWQGFGGFRVITQLSQNWSLRARADIGYQDSNNKSGHAIATFDYRFKQWGSAFVGYRFLDTEYDNGKSGDDGYIFDADQQGPILGVSFYF